MLSGKDGIKRNFARMREEWPAVWAALKRAKGSHDMYMDAFVETRRASPYFTGHIDAFLYPILVIVAVVGWIM